MGISEAAESIGFRTQGVQLTWEQLRDETPLPCIVHWNQSHLVFSSNILVHRKGLLGLLFIFCHLVFQHFLDELIRIDLVLNGYPAGFIKSSRFGFCFAG